MQMIITGKVHSDVTEHNPKWVTVRSLCLLCYFRDIPVYFNQIGIDPLHKLLHNKSWLLGK